MFEQDGLALNPVSHAINLYIFVRSSCLLSNTSGQALYNSSIYRANTATAYPFILDASTQRARNPNDQVDFSKTNAVLALASTKDLPIQTINVSSTESQADWKIPTIDGYKASTSPTTNMLKGASHHCPKCTHSFKATLLSTFQIASVSNMGRYQSRHGLNKLKARILERQVGAVYHGEVQRRTDLSFVKAYVFIYFGEGRGGGAFIRPDRPPFFFFFPYCLSVSFIIFLHIGGTLPSYLPSYGLIS